MPYKEVYKCVVVQDGEKPKEHPTTYSVVCTLYTAPPNMANHKNLGISVPVHAQAVQTTKCYVNLLWLCHNCVLVLVAV